MSKHTMMWRHAISAVVVVVIAAAIGVGSASAGEITGNGKATAAPANANSECSFSGLDDPDDDGFGRTQNWGQIPKQDREFLRSIGVSPESLCNGHLNPQK